MELIFTADALDASKQAHNWGGGGGHIAKPHTVHWHPTSTAVPKKKTSKNGLATYKKLVWWASRDAKRKKTFDMLRTGAAEGSNTFKLGSSEYEQDILLV